MKLLRSPILWGASFLAIITVVATVAAVLHIDPIAQKLVTFYTNDAASVRPGDQVRIAGITVGKVRDLELEQDRVRVRARVDDSAFVGDQSQVQVRMLTVVGGYYINIVSLGDVPLGMDPIPLERVTMPYNLMRTITDTTRITENVNPKPIEESLKELQNGLDGENVEVISDILDAGNGLMSTIDKQRGQITSILNLSDEYIEALSNFGDELKQLVAKVSILEQTLMLYHEGFGAAAKGMGDVLDSTEPLLTVYMNHRDDFLEKVRRWQEKARMWADRSGVIVRGLRVVRNKIERVLDAQNAPPQVLATDMCIPIPGVSC
jgi:virulence factor Mce-like protein